MNKDEMVHEVSDAIHCGLSLSKDLLMLAGWDASLVIEASDAVNSGVESLKAWIINERFTRLEQERED